MPTAPFDRLVGLEYTSLTPDGVTASLAITENLLQPHGIVHGGVYCSVVESVASVSAFVWRANVLGEESAVVGVNNNTDFLRAISTGTLTAASTPIHRVAGSSCGSSPSPTTRTGRSHAARCVYRTCETRVGATPRAPTRAHSSDVGQPPMVGPPSSSPARTPSPQDPEAHQLSCSLSTILSAIFCTNCFELLRAQTWVCTTTLATPLYDTKQRYLLGP